MNARFSKEFKVMRPAWVVALVLPLSVLLWGGESASFSIPLYFIGCALLGASSFGHDFNHRTLTLLLSQPVSRRRHWYEKMWVLGLVLLSLVALAFLVVIIWGINHSESLAWDYIYPLIILPALCAFCSGPLWTLLCRNPIGAVAFSLVTPFLFAGLLWLISNWLMPSQQEFLTEADERYYYYCIPVTAYAALAYLWGCWKFARLECRDSQAAEWSTPHWIKAPFRLLWRKFKPRQQGAVIYLLLKELHLQKINFLLAGLLCLVCPGVLLVHALRPSTGLWVYTVPLVAYLCILPITIGAVSVAEERSLGILPWHLTLPPPRWLQWLIKTLVAYGLIILLGMALPALWWSQGLRAFAEFNPSSLSLQNVVLPICIILAVTGLAIYASSLSTNALRAILLAFGFGVGTCLILQPFLWVVHEAVMPALAIDWHDSVLYALLTDAQMRLVLLMAAGAVAILVLMNYLAYLNYRRADLGGRQSWLPPIAVPVAMALVVCLFFLFNSRLLGFFF